MFKTAGRFKFSISLFCVIQLFIFIQAVGATDRNEVLLNLKEGFNGPVFDKSSFIGIICIIASVALLLLIVKFQSARDEKVLQKSRDLHLQRQRKQTSLGQQKRNWFRLKTDAEFLWIPAEMSATVKDNKYRRDHLIDLSGGGLSFSTTYQLKSGDEIRLRLFTGQANSFNLNGKVLRVKEEEARKVVSIEFIGIRDGYRDRIVTFLLNNQRNAIQEEKRGDLKGTPLDVSSQSSNPEQGHNQST